MGSLLEQVSPEVAQFAKENGLRVIGERYDPESFGNALVDLESDDFKLRVIRDRGEVSLQVSPPDRTDWHNLENALAFITGQSPPTGLSSLVRALSANIEKIGALMTSDLSKVGFLPFEEKQSAAFLNKLFPPP